jgi:hypothetical protein
MFRLLRLIRFLVPIAFVAFLLMQLVPYRVTNPSTRSEPDWDSARTRRLAVVACFDCHSNETKHHWWTQIAPMSWLTVKDVRAGRHELNFSEFGTGSEGDPQDGDVEDIYDAVAEGSMPPDRYTMFGLHKDAKLTEAERAELIAGLRRTLGEGDDSSGGSGHG